jgi:putative membrane protein
MMAWMWAWPGLLLVGVVVLGAVAYGLLRGGRAEGASPGRATAREILDERYARGELDGEEYRQRVDGLL